MFTSARAPAHSLRSRPSTQRSSAWPSAGTPIPPVLQSDVSQGSASLHATPSYLQTHSKENRCMKMVLAPHRVERFNPLGVHVAVADDPAALLQRLLHHLRSDPANRCGLR
eukprot:364232-Chlamydomonas_euryale.AAC.6